MNTNNNLNIEHIKEWKNQLSEIKEQISKSQGHSYIFINKEQSNINLINTIETKNQEMISRFENIYNNQDNNQEINHEYKSLISDIKEYTREIKTLRKQSLEKLINRVEDKTRHMLKVVVLVILAVSSIPFAGIPFFLALQKNKKFENELQKLKEEFENLKQDENNIGNNSSVISQEPDPQFGNVDQKDFQIIEENDSPPLNTQFGDVPPPQDIPPPPPNKQSEGIPPPPLNTQSGDVPPPQDIPPPPPNKQSEGIPPPPLNTQFEDVPPPQDIPPPPPEYNLPPPQDMPPPPPHLEQIPEMRTFKTLLELSEQERTETQKIVYNYKKNVYVIEKKNIFSQSGKDTLKQILLDLKTAIPFLDYSKLNDLNKLQKNLEEMFKTRLENPKIKKSFNKFFFDIRKNLASPIIEEKKAAFKNQLNNLSKDEDIVKHEIEKISVAIAQRQSEIQVKPAVIQAFEELKNIGISLQDSLNIIKNFHEKLNENPPKKMSKETLDKLNSMCTKCMNIQETNKAFFDKIEKANNFSDLPNIIEAFNEMDFSVFLETKSIIEEFYSIPNDGPDNEQIILEKFNQGIIKAKAEEKAKAEAKEKTLRESNKEINTQDTEKNKNLDTKLISSFNKINQSLLRYAMPLKELSKEINKIEKDTKLEQMIKSLDSSLKDLSQIINVAS